MIEGNYNRFDPAKNYEEHIFRAGYVLQSAELNEIQSAAKHRLRGIADAIFSDGDIINGASIIVNQDTGETSLAAGAIYVAGVVRGVLPKTVTIATVGEVVVGVRLVSDVVTENEDAQLRDPASLTRNYMEPGAARLQVHLEWGFDGDGIDGEFYPIHTVVDGVPLSRDAPPNYDAINYAIARHDRDNSGGKYVVRGFAVNIAPDIDGGTQSYSVTAGRARVNGFAVEYQTDTRVLKPVVPTLRTISAEPHLSATTDSQTFTLDRQAINEVIEVQITEEKTVSLTRGMVANGADTLPDASVLSLVEVRQGGQTYSIGSEVRLFQGKVDWSLSGDEPAGGSTYQVTYLYIKTFTPAGADIDIDEATVTVAGAEIGSLVLITYTAKLPQIDRLCLNQLGETVWVEGVPHDYAPVVPRVPEDLLLLATVYQTWGASRRIVNDGIRMVSMAQMEGMGDRIDRLADFVVRQSLVGDVNSRETGLKKGMLVDTFVDDSSRDLGIDQTAVCIDGTLALPVETEIADLDGSAAEPMVLTPASFTAALEQTSLTGSMKINPYQAFPVRPATVDLQPSRDFWTKVEVVMGALVTRVVDVATTTKRITNTIPYGSDPREDTTTVNTSSTKSSYIESLGTTRTGTIDKLRQINVNFTIAGFGPGEELVAVNFDGVPVTPTSI